MRFAAALLVAFSLPAIAQAPAQPPERTAPPRETGLKLQLDEADLRSLSRNSSAPRDPPGERDAGGLPSLGGDARKLERAPTTSEAPSSSGPFPPDTGREHGR